jgi:uncharacterized protein (TIGR02001 family)
MNKKITALVLSALTLGALSVSAQTVAPAPAPAAPTGSWVFTPAFASQYMFRGVRLSGPSFEPTIEYDYDALAVGLWANFPMKDKVVGQSDPELDFYAAYTIELQKDVATLVPGVTLYEYPNAKTSNGFYKTTFEPNLALNYTMSGLTLTPKIYYDFVLKGPTLELNAAYAVPLKEVGSELDFAATFGTYKWDAAVENSTPETKNWGNYWLAGVTMPFALTKDITLKLGWAYTKGSDNFFKTGSAGRGANPGAVGRGVATISCVFKF